MLKKGKLGEDQVRRRWREGEIAATKIEKSK
jgi:hypothetical protein